MFCLLDDDSLSGILSFDLTQSGDDVKKDDCWSLFVFLSVV